MIDVNDVKAALYSKYIEPTKKKRTGYIGVEIELPIVNLEKKAVDFQEIQKVTAAFIKEFDFQITGRDDDGYIYAAQDEKTGDILSYDCSYNNMEFSFGRERDLNVIHQRFLQYYGFMTEELAKYSCMLTGMGVNPYRQYNHNVPIANERYRMLFHHLGTSDRYSHLPMYFHPYTNYGTFASASQVQLDVSYERLIRTIQTFSLLEPVTGLLFSNSVMPEDSSDLLCVRDMFWENSTHGINPHNVGMFDWLPETMEDLTAYIASTSMYCVMRDGKYVNFSPIRLLEYFSSDTITGEYYENGSYHEITFSPELSDLEYLRSFKFEDLTFRGTIEYRSSCCQPVSEAMTIAAYYLGLENKLEELEKILKEDQVLYHHGYSHSELRKMLIRRNLPGVLDQDQIYELAGRILSLAGEGLKSRNLGEEKFLEPLFDRVKDRANPGKHMVEQLEAGISLESIIREYAKTAYENRY